MPASHPGPAADPIAIVGFECCLPDADGADAFARLLFDGRSSYGELPPDRFDRRRYYDPKRGQPGKSYTTVGGIVPERPIDRRVCPLDAAIEQQHDPTHVRFCEVATRAWATATLNLHHHLASRTGIYVGHSGGTKLGGALSMATQIEETLDFLRDLDEFCRLSMTAQNAVIDTITTRIRQSRPQRSVGSGPHFNAYSAAALAANTLGLGGPRSVIDAACASSLIALNHAILQMNAGRIDAALVGGATYNNVDNLILFSQSQACSADGSRPFDQAADGLISSEGYVAIVVTRLSTAQQLGLPVKATIRGLGVSSDGKGKSLWAPRTEGQQLAVQRAYNDGPVLDIDYLEAHATSTPLGDATELATISRVTGPNDQPALKQRSQPLCIGSVKSNLGHTLEAAGLVGLVKVLLSMQRGELPPSLGFDAPNLNFDWSNHPVNVVTKRQSWEGSTPRTAGVSAFGIGGLNAHLFVEEAKRTSNSKLPTSSVEVQPSTLEEPIAIVGRGVVLPGAHTREDFANLLMSGRSVIGDPPQGRWRGNVGLADISHTTAEHKTVGLNNHASQAFQTPTNRGGYIRDYQFDSESFRIPPKQVAQANPVQMMLLDAVTQAIEEFDGGDWSINTERMSVVIGAVFGGEFSNQLQAGLRLPEIKDELKAAIDQHASGQIDADRLADEFRTTLLKHRPALLDETGSFTASTLASRIAKTFNLMGGACALDADDASGLAALMVAIDQLQSGQADTVLCGSAQRSMDLVAFEQLELTGQLVRSGHPDDVPDDCSRVLPGEGVAVLMLMRLSDAQASGRTILGVIDKVTSAAGSTNIVNNKDAAALTRQIGYLSGTHSLVRLVAQSLRWQDEVPEKESTSTLTVAAQAEDGYTLATTLTPFKPRSPKPYDSSAPSMTRLSPSSPTRPVSRPTGHLIRLSAASESEFAERLRHAIDDPSSIESADSFDPGSPYRAALLTGNTNLVDQLKAIQHAWHQGTRNRVFERERAVLSAVGTKFASRIAWVFPGQGSQYDQRPAVFDESNAARDCLDNIDRLLEERGTRPLSSVMTETRQSVGGDVWWSQLWALGVGTSLMQALYESGLRPDVVAGHSFGEYTAAVAAGVLMLPQALRMTKQRADAVVMSVRDEGTLLSVRGAPAEVHAVIRQKNLPVVITHYNAPQQTVVAGLANDIESAKLSFNDAKLASISIPVAAAFHTEMMRPAEQVLRRGIVGEVLRPPMCGFLSTTRATYLAEPEDVRDSLVTQLTQPVMYEPTIRRLLNDGVGLLIEVGPNDVLTRLNREILAGEALCLSADVPGQSFADRIALIDAAIECVTACPHAETLDRIQTTPNSVSIERPTIARPSIVKSSVTTSSLSQPTVVSPESTDVEIVDVRRVSRRKASSPAESVESIRPTTPNTTASSNASSPASPLATPGTAVSTLVTASSEPSSQVLTFLTNVVVELTGYSPDVVDADAELEADLGLDSIKTAQIIGELAAWKGLQVSAETLRLADFRTLADIATLAEEESMESSSTEDAAVAEAMAETSPVIDVRSRSSIEAPTQQEDRAVAASASASAGTEQSALETLLIDFVVDQTGYRREIVDLDADLEADLGIDSIKKAQLLGELQAQFDLSSLSPEQLINAKFPTLRSIQEFLLSELVKEGVGSSTTTIEAESTIEPAVPIVEFSQTAQPIARPVVTVVRRTRRVQSTTPIGVDPRESFVTVAVASNGQSLESRAARRTLVDRRIPMTRTTATATSLSEITTDPNSHRSNEQRVSPPVSNSVASSLLAEPVESPTTRDDAVTHRFALRVVDAPQREGMPTSPELSGPALIVGDNAMAEAIAAEVQAAGQRAFLLSPEFSLDEIDVQLDRIWESGVTPHLFLATAHDANALASIDPRAWQSRRSAALTVPFRICQRWMQSTIEAKRMDAASVVAVVNLGGDYGFSGERVASVEAIGGLVKAMLIESWMAGCRTTPMKVIDVSSGTTPREAASSVFREMAVPSYDMEIATVEGQRRCVQAVPATLSEQGTRRGNEISRGGAWILTGGGRGITALTGMELAERHDLKLHLIGTAPQPDVDEATLKAAIADRGSLRRRVMQEAMSRGQNGIEAWRDTEKAIEIEITLAECRQRGITATYHSCDVSDVDAFTRVVGRIRETDGEIRGVIHGAGAGQDSRFDRKRPDKVEKCLKAKIDGALAVMEVTRQDPLEWFVAFGSISGRFGANGHTDYSLANDMMAKIVDRYRMERPEVTSLTFHWHAWGDVGMAMKPEAKLALEMIDMEFMPAAEGLDHFLREFALGGDEPEVLITDRSYFKKFFPAERVTAGASSTNVLPLLHGCARLSPFVATLDPEKDKFLAQHRVSGVPTLPFVVAVELLAEGARRFTNTEAVIECRNVKAFTALKCTTDDAVAVQISAKPMGPKSSLCRLQADVRRRDGRLVEEARTYFEGEFVTGRRPLTRRVSRQELSHLDWQTIDYPDDVAGPIYHGPELRSLSQVAIDGDVAYGKIGASAAVQLFGSDRPSQGWTLSADAMDACLYTAAVLGWHRSQKPSLPVGFDSIIFGRLPDAGEPCIVRVESREMTESGMTFSFQLIGLNRDLLLDVNGYRIAWLG